MAFNYREYYWVGRQVAPTASVQDKILQYCWNDPRNWLTRAVGSNLPLVGATLSPSGYSVVQFGTYTANPAAGWTHAKSPCLFGGYINHTGVTVGILGHIGTWDLYGSASGFTWQNYYGGDHLDYGTHLNGFYFINDKLETVYPTAPYNYDSANGGYPFPYLGGGIVGPILDWCAARDGLSVSAYTMANSGSSHNPSNPLSLTNTWYEIDNEQVHVIPASLGEYTEIGLAKLIIDIQNVPSYDGHYSWTNDGRTKPSVEFARIYTHGSGVIIRDLFAKQVKVNYRHSPTFRPDRSQPRSEVIDYGIQLINPIIYELDIGAHARTSVVGGEISRCRLSFSEANAHLYGLTSGAYYITERNTKIDQIDSPLTGFSFPAVISPAPPITFECGWDYQWLHELMFGITGAAAADLDGITWQYRGSISSSVDSVAFTNQQALPDDTYRNTHPEGLYIYPYTQYPEEVWRNFHHDVIVKPGTHSRAASPERVQLSGSDNSGQLFIQPRLLLSGATQFIFQVDLTNATIARDPNSITEVGTTSFLNVNLGFNSTFDFTTAPSYQGWRVGGFCGSNQIFSGGINFADRSNNRVKAGSNHVFWAAAYLDDSSLREAGISGAPALPSLP